MQRHGRKVAQPLQEGRHRCAVHEGGGRTRIFHVEGEWEDLRETLGKEDFVKGRKAALLPLFEDMKSWLEEVVR